MKDNMLELMVGSTMDREEKKTGYLLASQDEK
jgi:hypothetical protein